jgi:hypothetical protein
VSTPTGSDPIDRLHAADPVHADEVPDASLARVTARVQEHIMSDKQFDPTVRPSRGPLAWVGGIAVVGAVVLAIAFGPGGLGIGPAVPSPGPIAANPTPTEPPLPSADPTASGDPAPSDNPAAGGGMASCLRYDPSILPTFDVVLDGTVTAIAGDQVTFKVNDGWKGAKGSITLTVPQAQIGLTGPLPDFRVGGRYLVSAADTHVNACGYTLEYDAATAAAWAAAFGG